MPKVTNTPTARNASSLTSDSNAIAATMPWWCSAASRWRVPKAMVNAARIKAIHKRRVLADRRRAELRRHDDLGILHEDREAVRYRLQLQRDVRKDADHRDDGDEAAEQRALAIARGDEVGERGDAVLLRDAQDLAHHDPPQRDHQRRTDVDRQEADAVARRAADAAVERPRGRIDRERQAVDVRVRDHRAAGVGTLVREIGDREQQPEVGERGEDDERAVQHAAGSLPSVAVARFGHQRHQRDQRRPRREDVGVQHGYAEYRAGDVEQREDRVVEQQHAEHAQRHEALAPASEIAHQAPPCSRSRIKRRPAAARR